MPRTLIDTGSVVAANTLFTACTSAKIVESASAMPDKLVAAKYLPLLTDAMLFSSLVWSGKSVGQVSVPAALNEQTLMV